MPDRDFNDEEPSAVDSLRYAEIVAALEATRSRTGPADRDTTAIAAVLLHQEARLLDGGRYRDWLTLLTADCVYWLPDAWGSADPRKRSGINLDDRRRLIDRIVVIETGLLKAQEPASRTSRIVTNIEAWPDGAGVISVRSNCAVWEHRRAHTTCYVGWQLHELVRRDGAWQIRTKIIHLLDCDEPQGNLTFIL